MEMGLATPKPLNRSSPKLACVIRSWSFPPSFQTVCCFSCS